MIISTKDKLLLVISFCLLSLGFLLFQTVPWIGNIFGRVTIDAIIFHFNIGDIKSVDPSLVISYCKRIFVSLISSLLLVCIVIYIRTKILKFKKAIVYFGTASAFIFCMSCVFFTVQLGVIDYIYSLKKDSTFIKDNYITSNLVVFPEKKKNIIVLMLESMDSSFTTTEVFPQVLTPRLQKIQNENASFPLLHQTTGTGWTMGSMVGLFFGVPLKLPISGNLYNERYSSFLPGAQNILDILSEEEYSSHLLLGGSAEFAGMKNMYLSHTKNAYIYDKDYLISLAESKGEPLELAGWGIRDIDLYKYLRSFLDDISQKKAPFFLLMQTIDTHTPSNVYDDGGVHLYDDKRDAFVTADALAADFVDWFKQQDFYEDTVLLIIGDHNYMGNELAGFQLLPHRTIYNVFINSDLPLDGPNAIRQATMLDFAPTLLEAIGAQIPERRFGLGVSLVGSYPTLYESLGEEELAQQLSLRSEFYNKFF